MPKRTNEFQQLIHLINHQLKDSAKVEESAMLKDKVTGQDREVDVVVTDTVGAYPVRVCVECVAWKKEAPVTWVEQMRAKHDDLPTSYLVLCSVSGFSKSALVKARHYGIRTVTLDRSRSVDWPAILGEGAQKYLQLGKANLIATACTAVLDGPMGRWTTELPAGARLERPEGVVMVVDFARELLRDRRVTEEAAKRVDDGLAKGTINFRPQSVMQIVDTGSLRHSVVELAISFDCVNTSSPRIPLQPGLYDNARVAWAAGTTPLGDFVFSITELSSADTRISLMLDGEVHDAQSVRSDSRPEGKIGPPKA